LARFIFGRGLAYAKGKKKKFQPAFGRLSAAMIDVESEGGKMTVIGVRTRAPDDHRSVVAPLTARIETLKPNLPRLPPFTGQTSNASGANG
jgi:hypothetical protein